MEEPSHYLPDGSPVYDTKKPNDSNNETAQIFATIIMGILAILGVIALFVGLNVFLKLIGAPFYLIPIPFLK